MSVKIRLVICLFFLPLSCESWATDPFDPGNEPSLDFLYINANAGEAAGGHTALRLGDTVFHYQFFPDESFLLVRDSWASFRFLYNDLHNRSIAIASLPLEKSLQQRIENHFTELLARQQQFFAELDQLHKEKQYVTIFLNYKFDLVVNGLGFFTPSTGTTDTSSLRRHISSILGDDYLSLAHKTAEQTVQQLTHDINGGGSFDQQQLLELVSLQEALRILLKDSQLDGQALISSMIWEKSLDEWELAQLEKFGKYLQASITSLLQSRRPDRGETLLLQTARYLAVRQSLATSQLVTLDPYFEAVRTVELEDEDVNAGKLTFLQNELRKQAARYRELFFQNRDHPEISCSLLETSRARAWELSRVSDEYRRVRVLVRPVLPAKPGAVIIDNLCPDRDILQAEIRQLDRMISSRYQEREEQYGYSLFSHNCATELIRSLNGSFSDPRVGETAFGGRIEADEGLLFIPFLFYNQIKSGFAINKEQFLPARRLRNLEQMYTEEDNFLVWLRESNTLTSTLYDTRTKDTPFFFFTDDSFFLRPFLGVVNMGYASLYGVVSLFTIPFDGGDRLHQAGRGIFYSLPELTFGNIRKGSYPLGDVAARP